MACARPVLACTDPNSDLALLISQAHCGVVVAPGDAAALAQSVSNAMADTPAGVGMGENGRAYVTAHYARQTISARYDALLREVAG
jgi:colanic acid biosynthesis glycosyl transferase WcaI